MKSHAVDFEILGSEMQIVEVELDPGETVVAEAGAMNYMEDGIEFTAKMGDGSEPEQGFFAKLAGAGKRMLTSRNGSVPLSSAARASSSRNSRATAWPSSMPAVT